MNAEGQLSVCTLLCKKKKKEGTFQEEEKVFSKEDITKEDHRLNVCVSPEFIG